MDKDTLLTESGATLRQIVASMEREQMLAALEANKWNATKAAKSLGISYRAMRYRMLTTGIKELSEKRHNPLGAAWPALRYKALVKYGNRCHCCGSNPRTGATLHVDHIKPRDKYPDLAMDIDNLQILCARCHQSKGSNDETDWR